MGLAWLACLFIYLFNQGNKYLVFFSLFVRAEGKVIRNWNDRFRHNFSCSQFKHDHIWYTEEDFTVRSNARSLSEQKMNYRFRFES